MPYWELASTLRQLSIGYIYRYWWIGTEAEISDELEEALLTSVKLPSLPFRGSMEETLHCDIANRTIVAAARGGNLRQLLLSSAIAVSQKSFAVRALLPYWVAIDDFGSWETHMCRAEGWQKQWYHAARTLRTVLAHCSLWLEESHIGARNSRLLTREDVQALRGYFSRFTAETLPKAFTFTILQGSARKIITRPFAIFGLYLPWLEEDAELAQQVADAWNAVVDRGEADVVKCKCEQCEAR